MCIRDSLCGRAHRNRPLGIGKIDLGMNGSGTRFRSRVTTRNVTAEQSASRQQANLGFSPYRNHFKIGLWDIQQNAYLLAIDDRQNRCGRTSKGLSLIHI